MSERLRTSNYTCTSGFCIQYSHFVLIKNKLRRSSRSWTINIFLYNKSSKVFSSLILLSTFCNHIVLSDISDTAENNEKYIWHCREQRAVTWKLISDISDTAETNEKFVSSSGIWTRIFGFLHRPPLYPLSYRANRDW